MSEKSSCGPLVEVLKTDGVRIAKCPCGNVHLTFAKTGVTIQLAAEYFTEVSQALALAKTIMEGPTAANTRIAQPITPGTFVSIVVDDKKKPAN